MSSRPRPSQTGSSIVEAMLGLLVLSVALLTHLTGVMGEHRLVGEGRDRSGALLATSQVLERLRADEDKPGLYGRLRQRAQAARLSGELATGEVRLSTGRRAYPPTTYFPDFVASPGGDVHVLIDVPLATPVDPSDPRPDVLREDLADAPFGLPLDLNGDGVVDDQPRDDDYLLLPVRLYVYWKPSGEAARELKMAAWIRGER